MVLHILKLAEIISIKKKRAQEVIDEVKLTLLKWKKFADKAVVTKKSSAIIQSNINFLGIKYFRNFYILN